MEYKKQFWKKKYDLRNKKFYTCIIFKHSWYAKVFLRTVMESNSLQTIL